MKLLRLIAVLGGTAAGAANLDGTWTSEVAKGKVTRSFKIEGTTIHWNGKQSSQITRCDDSSLLTDLAGLGENLHDYATISGGKISWSNGDVWVHDVPEPATPAPIATPAPMATPAPVATPAPASAGLDLAALDGVWTEKDAPGSQYFVIKGAKLTGAGPAPAELVPLSATSVSSVLAQGASTAQVATDALKWDVAGTWVRVSAEELAAGVDGLWTRKAEPGAEIYTIGGGELRGDGLPKTSLKVEADGRLATGRSESPAVGQVAGAELQWQGQAGAWIRLSPEAALGALSGLYTEKQSPGDYVFSIADGKVSGPGLEPAAGAALTVAKDGGLATALSKGPTAGQLAGGALKWSGDAGTWVRLTAAQATASLSGMWTEQANPGDRIYSIRDGQLSAVGENSSVAIAARADGTVTTTLEGAEASGTYTGTQLNWGEHGIWVRLSNEQALEGLKGVYTEERDPGAKLFTIRGGSLRGGGLSATISVTEAGVVETDLTEGPVKGEFTEDDIRWGGSTGTWVRLAGAELLGALGGLWTEKEEPGKHVYSVRDGHVYSEQFGEGASATLDVGAGGGVKLTIEGECTSGSVAEPDLIRWEQGSEWIRMSSTEVFALTDGLWTQKAKPGAEVYALHAGTVKGGGLDGTLALDAEGYLVLTDPKAETTEQGQFLSGEIQWQGDRGTWVVLDPSLATKEYDGLWVSGSGRVYHIAGGKAASLGQEPIALDVGGDGSIEATMDGSRVSASYADDEITWTGGERPDTWTRTTAEALLASLDGFWEADMGTRIYVVSGGAVTADLLADPVITSIDLSVTAEGGLEASGNFTAAGAVLSFSRLAWQPGGNWKKLTSEEILEGLWLSTSGKVHSIEAGAIDGGAGGDVSISSTAALVLGASAQQHAKEPPAELGDVRGGALCWFQGAGAGGVWRRPSAAQVMTLVGGLWTEEAAPGKKLFTIWEGSIFGEGLSDEGVPVTVSADGALQATLGGSSTTGQLRGQKLLWSGPVGTWIPFDSTKAVTELDGVWNSSGKIYHIASGKVSGPGLDAPAPLALVSAASSTQGPRVSGPIAEDGNLAPIGSVSKALDQISWNIPGSDDIVWVRTADVKFDMPVQLSLHLLRPVKDVLACSQPNIAWMPLDMPGQPLTIEANVSMCVRRCALVKECAHYTWSEAMKTCHIEDAFASISYNAMGFTSGPPGCSQKGGRNANTSMIVLQGETCWKEGFFYGAADPTAVGQATTIVVDSALNCKHRCSDYKWCKAWSYDFAIQTCSMNTEQVDDAKVLKLPTVVGGPPFCPKLTVYYTIRLKGVNYTAIMDDPAASKDLIDSVRFGVVNFKRILAMTGRDVSALSVTSFVGNGTNDSDANATDTARPDSAEHVEDVLTHKVAMDTYTEDAVFIDDVDEDGDQEIPVFVRLGKVDQVPVGAVQKMLTENKEGLRFAVLYSVKENFNALPIYAFDVVRAEGGEIVIRGPKRKDVTKTPKCQTSPLDWTDSEGETCESYAKNHLCTKEGQNGEGWDPAWGRLTDFASQGRSALQACCQCGGGTSNDRFPRAQVLKTEDVESLVDDAASVSVAPQVASLVTSASGGLLVLGVALGAVAMTTWGRRVLRGYSLIRRLPPAMPGSCDSSCASVHMEEGVRSVLVLQHDLDACDEVTFCE